VFAKYPFHHHAHLGTCILSVLPIHGDVALETAQKFMGDDTKRKSLGWELDELRKRTYDDRLYLSIRRIRPVS